MKKGFTLIELLVVISIIGVLMGLLLVAFQGTRKSARDGKRKADLEQIRSALEMYRTDKGSYPTTYWYRSTEPTEWAAFANILRDYMPSLPTDPINNWVIVDCNLSRQYIYTTTIWGVPGAQYILATNLENDTDSVINHPGCCESGNSYQGACETDYYTRNP